MSGPENPQYVRFGAVRRSYDLNTGELLPGASVYPGRLVEPDLFRIDLSDIDPAQGWGYLVVLAACDRPAFFVEGEEVGTGPDGEPLLRVADHRPVPKTTAITSIQTATLGALEMWSRGPRDSSATNKVLRKRLKAGTEWTGTTQGVRFDPAVLSTFVVNPQGVRRKGERKGRDLEERREKNRARKRYRREKKRARGEG